MIITQEQKDTLIQNNVEIFDNTDDTLLALDDKITEIGFNSDYTLNKTGLMLQRLYDDLYYQNN